MTVEIIADGCHLPTELLELVYRVKGVKKTALTCDSIEFAGQEVKEASVIKEIRGRYYVIEDGVIKLPDRSCFAGSIATDDRLIRVMHHGVGIPLHDAVSMMTLTPARIAGIDDKKGSVAEGKDADLICFDDQIQVKGTMVACKGMSGNLVSCRKFRRCRTGAVSKCKTHTNNCRSHTIGELGSEAEGCQAAKYDCNCGQNR